MEDEARADVEAVLARAHGGSRRLTAQVRSKAYQGQRREVSFSLAEPPDPARLAPQFLATPREELAQGVVEIGRTGGGPAELWLELA